MATFQNLCFFQGEDWPIAFECVDELGNDFTPDAIALRIASQTGVVIEVDSPSTAILIAGVSVSVSVAAALQTMTPTQADQFFTYEVRGFCFAPARSVTQMAGTIRMRPSVFASFPFTPPGSPAVELAAGGDLRLASGGRLLLAA